MHRYQSFGHRHLGPLADATEMMRIAERHDARSEALGTLDRHLHRLAADHLAVALAAVNREQRSSIDRDLRTLVRREPALEHGVDIARDHADAVRVVPEQICSHQVLGHQARLCRLAAAGGNDRLDGACQRLGLE